MTWARDPIENQYLVSGQLKKTRDLDELHTWARDMVTWCWSVDTFFWQVSLIVTWMSNIKEVNGKPRLHVSVNLLLEHGRHLARLRRRRRRGRAYAPTSNTASHDNHEKIHWWVFLDFHTWDAYGAPLGDPSGRRNSATNTNFEFQTSDVSRAFALHVEECSLWDEIDMWRNNVKPAHWRRKVVLVLHLVIVLKS